MNEKSGRKRLGTSIDNIIIFLWCMGFFLFPLVVSTHTTNAFILPKQALILFIVLLSLLLWGVKIITQGFLVLRRTPFDFPILFFTIALLVSSLLSINRFDALITFISFIGLILAYFIVVNIGRRDSAILLLLSALVAGASVLSIVTIFSYFKIYLLPFSYAHNQSFTLLGSYLEQAFYIGFILPISAYFTYPLLKGKADVRNILFSAAFLLNACGLLFTILFLTTTQKPLILPFETGFQIAFAAISQDGPRIFQGFFFGSGFGTFFTDFTRFKLATFNLNPNLWYLTFTQSSSFILELLTTTGLLGLLSFFFIIYRVFKKSNAIWVNPITLSLFIGVIIAFALPMSFFSLGLFFFLLALFSAIEAFNHPDNYFDLEIQTFAKKKHISEHEEQVQITNNGISKFISIVVFLIILIMIGFLGWFGTRYVLSDIYFQQSLAAAAKNNGNLTYQKQLEAIKLFEYRDGYYRIFSQTNLILANSFVAMQPKGKKLSPDAQKTLYQLVQNSINAARAATTTSPLNVANWQNLASVYRALIGFGENAEKFTIDTLQQSIALDRTNPQEYIVLGGVYYQLGQYDNAIAAFQVAIQLKPDLANAYYNLGHALEQKGDYKSALEQYNIVKQLINNDAANKKKIEEEIAAIEKKIASSEKDGISEQKSEVKPSTEEQELNVNKPSNVFPTQKPQVKIPAPTKAVSPVASPTPKEE